MATATGDRANIATQSAVAPSDGAAATGTPYFDTTGRLTAVGEQRRDRLFGIYTIANGMSFNLVSSTFVLLYAIAYGADERFIGLLSGCINMSMLAGFFSVFFLATFGPSRLMGWAWSTRYLFAAGLLAAPWVAAQPQFGTEGALGVIFLCVLGFSAVRAIGASAWLPLVHSMTTPENRIGFMTGNSFRFRIGGAAGILGSVVYLSSSGGQHEGDPERLWWLILVGVVVGSVAVVCLFLMPQQEIGAQTPKFAQMRSAAVMLWRRPAMRYFLLATLLMMAGIGLFQAQRVYYMRKIIHFTTCEVACIDAAAMLGSAGCVYALRKLAARFGEMRLLRLTLVGLVVVGGSFGLLPENPWMLAVALTVWNTGVLWVLLSTDRAMLAECDQKSSTVLPVIWSSTKDVTMGAAMMVSGHLVRAIMDAFPALDTHSQYWLFDNVVMLVLVAGVGTLAFARRRYPLSGMALETDTDSEADALVGTSVDGSEVEQAEAAVTMASPE
ncbi:MAG TPA: hypothetical protein VL860_04280 [Planctomycetota bacterium]|nr:hypothetical protein [Planctomycetota bacterium]